MKNLFFTLLALLALTLTGCVEQTQEQRDANMASHITEFNYKGHRYLFYKSYSGYKGYAGITHDPDCPCRNKRGENE